MSNTYYIPRHLGVVKVKADAFISLAPLLDIS